MKITKQQLSVILESVGIQNPYTESDEYPKYPEKWVKEFKSEYNIDLNVDPAADENYAIQIASKNGYVEVVKLLLADKRVDLADNDNIAIILASKNGHVEVVKLLLSDKRVDPSAANNLAIRWASEKGEKGNTEVVKLLLADKRVVTDDSFSISKVLEKTKDAETKKVLLLWAKDNRK